MKQITLLFFVLTLISTGFSKAQLDQKNHINGTAHINPKNNQIKSYLRLKLKVNVNIDSITFFLHSGLKVNNVTGEGVKSFEVKPATNVFGMEKLPFTNFLIIYTNQAVNESLSFEISYQGKINSDEIVLGPDAFSAEWVELSLGSAWFPIHTSLDKKFTHHIKVILPESYTVAGIGKRQNIEKGVWIIDAETPNLDMILVAAKDLKVIKTERQEYNTEVYYTPERADSTIAFISNSANRLLQYYNQAFGESVNYQKIILPPDRGRAKPEGYSRKPFIMLNHTQNADTANIFYFLAHEQAHFWWNKGNTKTKDNFINESFAEYSYMMALREFSGKKAFKKAVEEKKDKLKKSLPSINDLADHLQLNYDLVYVKGPLLLYELEQRLGRKNFIILLQNSTQITSLEEFCNLIGNRFGDKHKKWFVSNL